MEVLADLLDQWGKNGLPEMPPLANIGLPTFDAKIFDIEEHWTTFIDKTVRYSFIPALSELDRRCFKFFTVI